MKSNSEINTKIIEGLQSDDLSEIQYSLNLISETGNSLYIAPVIRLLHSTTHKEVKSLIQKLLSELKHSDSRIELINAIKDSNYESDLQILVSACWENGLDFSPYIGLFVDLVIKKPFIVSFEAFTVIENMEANINDSIKEVEIRKIEEALIDSKNIERNHLLQELLKIIPAIKG